MKNFINGFESAIDLRIQYVMSQLFLKHGLVSDEDDEEIRAQAFCLGQVYPHSDSIFDYLEGTPLQVEYVAGGYFAPSQHDERECNSGTLREWKALPENEREEHWENFHEQCLQGTADDMYFYDVMMRIFLVGYVGH